MTKNINLTLKVWRQNGSKDKGRFDTYHADNITTDMSFLEMLDVVNDQLTIDDKEPIAFDHDCREGICGQCGCVVDGRPHGAEKGTTLCQLHMRHFNNGDTIVLGGIYEQITRDEVDKVPLLGDIPVLGYLFKHTLESDEKAELLIFVTPKILKDTLSL